MRARFSTRLGLIAALVAIAALVVSPAATTASFTIVPDGPAVVVEVNNSGGTSTATFSGTAGQRVSLNITNVTITSSKVSLQQGGTNVLTPFSVTRTGYFMDVQTLPMTGTYKFVVDPKDTYTGRMTLRLYDVPPDPVNPISAGGAAVPATTTTPGQNALFTFTGTAGQRVSAEVSSVALTGGSAKLRLLKPDGTALATPVTFGNAGGFLEPQTLPVDGVYTLVADPVRLAKGSFSVQLFDVPADLAVALTPDGPDGTAATTQPGQNAAFTFTATAGVRYSVKLTDSTYGSAKVSWLKPDGTPVFSPSLAISQLGTFLTPRTLTTGGEYKIFVDPQLAETGSVKAQVFTVPPDLTGAITPGTPLNVAISAPGQNASYTFTGTKDRRVSLHVTNNTFERVSVSILKPDGTALFSPALTLISPEGFRDPVVLPATGTYKVKIDPADAATGALDVGVYDVTADATATIAPDGVPVTVTTTSPGQNARLTFALTSVKRVSLDVSGVTMASSPSLGLSLKIVKPDGTTLTSATLGTNGTFIDTQSLTQTGTWKILLNPSDAAVGSATLKLYTVPADVTVPIVAGGPAVPVATGTPGQNAVLTFNGAANQRVFIKVSSISGGTSAPKVILKKTSSSSNIVSRTASVDPYYIDTQELGSSSGQFQIVFDPQGANLGSATFQLWTVPADVTGTLTPGSNTVNIPNIGQKARVTFTGTVGQTATIAFDSATIETATVRIYGPTGTQLESAFWDSSLSSNEELSELLPATGTYTFYIDPTNEHTGSVTFTLSISASA